MEYNKNLKNLTAIRLKELREKKGLSHDKLAEVLSKTYYKDEGGGVLKRTEDIPPYDEFNPTSTISSGVLKNYEVTSDRDVVDSRMKAGFGMSISYIVMFADFYGVSVEYLLGLSEVQSIDIDTKAIHEKTGLSEGAIEYISSLNDVEGIDILNRLIELEEFHELLYQIGLFRLDTIDKLVYLENLKRDGKEYENKLVTKSLVGKVTLDSLQYYIFRENQLKDDFLIILRNWVDTLIESKDYDNLVKENSYLTEVSPTFTEIRFNELKE